MPILILLEDNALVQDSLSFILQRNFRLIKARERVQRIDAVRVLTADKIKLLEHFTSLHCQSTSTAATFHLSDEAKM